MIENLPVIIGVGILAGAIAAACIWVEWTHRKYQKLIRDLTEKQKS